LTDWTAFAQTTVLLLLYDMRRYLHLLVTIALAGVMTSSTLAEKKRAKQEKGFMALFDGSSTEHWMNARSGQFPAKGWSIEDDSLKCTPKGDGGDIITRDIYEQFDFRFEWKLAKGANSGVKYFVIRERGSLGHEYQVIDDAGYPNGGSQSTASFYDVLAPVKDKQLKPTGEFNTSRILVKGQTVKHFLNGKLVLSYDLGSAGVKAAVASSKFKELEVFGVRLPGHILLQDHGGEVWYRNIRIRNLSEK